MAKKNKTILAQADDLMMSLASAYLVANDPVRIDSHITLFKLLFFADRYHLRMYGSTITRDKYVAMEMGPVPSMTKTLVNTPREGETLYRYVERGENGFRLIQDPDLDEFSDSELEALDAAIAVHRQHPTIGQLIDFSHKFPEWKKPSVKLRDYKKMEKMAWKDWFTPNVSDDYCPADEERLAAARSYWNESGRHDLVR